MSTPKMKIKVKDTVVVTVGNKGKQGKVIRAFPKEGKIIVEGVAMVKRHQKPRAQGMPGGIIEKESAIPVSNVMLVCKECKKPTRVGYKFQDNGKKVRVCKNKECGAVIDN